MDQPNTNTRPFQTQELILRIQKCDQQEQQALQRLCCCMVEVFKDSRKTSYLAEAAAISAVNNVDLKSLVITFSNLISKGTADGNIKEQDILSAFAYVLWHAKEPHMRSKLGTVLDCLYKRLKAAETRGEIATQYELVRCLSTVVDAMVEIKFKGLDRETIHAPLLKLLKKLAKSKELRLAQAAGYATEGLISIPNNEGPWHAVWRYSQAIITIAAKTAGVVTTMDPTKIIDAVPNMMDLLEVVKFGFEHASDFFELANKSETSLTEIWSKSKSWYSALRYTDLLLQCRAWNQFQHLVKLVPCRVQEEFLCGIFSQLESAWVMADRAGDTESKSVVVELFRSISTSKHQIVLEWRNLVARTLGVDCVEIKISRLALLHQKYTPTLKFVIIKATVSTSNASPLLNQAWSQCAEARLFYADAKLRSFYLEGDRLDIKRLSGDLLSMESCYINLAIIPGVREVAKADFSLRARLGTNAEIDNQVALEEFFKPRNLIDGRHGQPKRILVQGRAGVGKTTLCKKLVHRLLHGLWKEKFARILWLPLRRLKGRSYNLQSMIYAEYFGGRAGEEDLAEILASDSAQQNTLYLLDGLDEVTQEWNTDSLEYRFLQDLLCKPYVITTSRPSGMKNLNFDLELETIGFLPEQVDMYLEKCVDKADFDAIQTFLQDKPLIMSLIQIPIQLDALCYCWQAVKSSGESAPTTMTTLYEVLRKELWRKDLCRHNKFTESRAQELAGFEIDLQTNAEQSLLEWFAFQGLQNAVFDFTFKHQRILSSSWSQLGEQIPQSYTQILAESSFIRSSEPDSRNNQTYHFLHLTFEEFFAAKYFVKHWRRRSSLIILDLDDKPGMKLSTVEFIQNQKYNPRYNIFWRFVSGLMQMQSGVFSTGLATARKSEEGSEVPDIVNFFDQLHAPPVDLLGTSHYGLIVCCLNELVSSDQGENTQELLRRREEDLLKNRLAMESRRSGNMGLGYVPEFPERVLRDLLEGDESFCHPNNVLHLILLRYIISSDTLHVALQFMDNKFDIEVRTKAILVIFKHSRTASKEVFAHTIGVFQSVLQDEDVGIRKAMIEHMQFERYLPEEVILSFITILENDIEDIGLRIAIIHNFENLGSPLPETVIACLIKFLESLILIPEEFPPTMYVDDGSKNLQILHLVADALRSQLSLPQSTTSALLTMCKSNRVDVRTYAVFVLSKHCSSLPEEIISSVLEALKHKSFYIAWRTVLALQDQPNLSLETVDVLLSMLMDKDFQWREMIAVALEGQRCLPENIVIDLITGLSDRDTTIQYSAARILNEQSFLSEAHVALITKVIKEDLSRGYNVRALGGQASLPEELQPS